VIPFDPISIGTLTGQAGVPFDPNDYRENPSNGTVPLRHNPIGTLSGKLPPRSAAAGGLKSAPAAAPSPFPSRRQKGTSASTLPERASPCRLTDYKRPGTSGPARHIPADVQSRQKCVTIGRKP
jgi:hypothetical protein